MDFFNYSSSLSSLDAYNDLRSQATQHRYNAEPEEDSSSSRFETNSLREALPSFRERSEEASTSSVAETSYADDATTSGRTSDRNTQRRSTLARLGRFLSRSSSSRRPQESDQSESRNRPSGGTASPERASRQSSIAEHAAALSAYSVEVPSLLSGSALFSQNGHICKPTALANLDLYFSRAYGVGNIPLRKDQSGGYGYREGGLSSGNANVSVRQLAKSHGSAQGEVLESQRLVGVARSMGYDTSVVQPRNLDHFRQVVLDNLSARQPLLTCFSVDTHTAMPTRDYRGNNEHACLVVGASQSRDTLTIAHWGQVYRDIPMADMYASMNSLPSARDREIYVLSSSRKRRASSRYMKYDLVSSSDGYSRSRVRRSITPSESSGFKNKVLVAKPDLSNRRWRGY